MTKTIRDSPKSPASKAEQGWFTRQTRLSKYSQKTHTSLLELSRAGTYAGNHTALNEMHCRSGSLDLWTKQFGRRRKTFSVLIFLSASLKTLLFSDGDGDSATSMYSSWMLECCRLYTSRVLQVKKGWDKNASLSFFLCIFMAVKKQNLEDVSMPDFIKAANLHQQSLQGTLIYMMHRW